MTAVVVVEGEVIVVAVSTTGIEHQGGDAAFAAFTVT